MTNIEHREPMIRAAREALERHEPPDDDADDDGRALAVVLAMEPLIADQLQGAADLIRDLRESLIEHAPVARDGHWAADVERLIERANTFQGAVAR